MTIPLADGLTVAVEGEFSELFPFTGAVNFLKYNVLIELGLGRISGHFQYPAGYLPEIETFRIPEICRMSSIRPTPSDYKTMDTNLLQSINKHLINSLNNKTLRKKQKYIPKDLWVCIILHLILVRLLCVQPEGLARLCTSGTTGALLSRSLTDGGNKQRFHSNTRVVYLK